MPSNTDIHSADGVQAQPPWTNPDLPPDQFLYSRLGPWPQPAPAYPMTRPPEVLNIPTPESVAWWEWIGSRLFKTYLEEKILAPFAARTDLTYLLPTDKEFVRIVTQTVYGRYLCNEAGTTF